MNRIPRYIAGLLVLVMAVPALAQVTDSDVQRARDEMNALIARSADLGAQVEAAYALQYALESEIASLTESIEFARIQLNDLEARIEDVAVAMYMGSSTGNSLKVLFSSDDEAYSAGSQYLEEVNGVDTGVINELKIFRRELDQQTARLAEASVEEETNAAELEVLAGQLYADLADAQSFYDGLVTQQAIEEEQRRQAEIKRQEEARLAAIAATSTTTIAAAATTAPSATTTTRPSGGGSATTTAPPVATTTSPPPPPPPPSGNGACPVAGAVYFGDTWGDARSGGRSHQGVDMMAARGTPTAAIFSGTIKRTGNSSLGGIYIWLRSTGGDEFYYAHLDELASGISVGKSVTVGEIIGYVGSTGNASDAYPHLHFEYHPGGGSAINPYPLVKGICG